MASILKVHLEMHCHVLPTLSDWNSKSRYSLRMERCRRWKVMVSGVVSFFWDLPNLTSSLRREKWGSWVRRPSIICEVCVGVCIGKKCMRL